MNADYGERAAGRVMMSSLACLAETIAPVNGRPRALRTGDVVRLKSGGPRMTVGETDDDRAGCAWFDEPGDAQLTGAGWGALREFTFSRDALEIED